jgi:peptidyl-prolyl cis-trans isomerase B (cyclophilin B)
LLKTNTISFYLRLKKTLSLRFIAFLVVVGFFIGIAPVFAQTEISDKVVVLHTQSGDMVIELFPGDAPRTVENFLNLTEHGLYDRTVFHRVIKDFMIQGGDPKTKPGGYKKLEEWGTGDAGYTIPGEFNTIKHKRGIVSMARSSDPDSGSSQFFIVHKDSPHLDQNYAVFGRLATQTSFETLDKIANLENQGEPTNYVPFDWGKGEILKAEVKNHSEIEDLLDQGEPERVSTGTNQTTQPYSNARLGFSFDAPAGWLVQEPQKLNLATPDVVATGARVAGFTPAISISVKDSNGTSLKNYSTELKKIIQPAIDSGILSLLNEEMTTINGNDAFVRDALGKFNMTSGTLKVKFKEVVIKSSDKFYILTYTNSENNFDAALPKFNSVVNSFKTPSAGEISDIKQPNGGGGGCLIATAAHGSELAPQVQMLREIRDDVVFGTASGITFMGAFNDIYYSFSPTIADWERQNPMFKEVVKMAITPMLSTLSILNHVEIDSEQEMLGYGIGIIVLNGVLYFVAPTIIVIKAKKIAKIIARI